ncbi:MAG: DMT family transporter [bacterium]
MKHKSSIVFALLVAIIWGVSFVATKIVVEQIPPATIGFLRFVIAYISLTVIVKMQGKREKIARPDRFPVIMMGLTGVTLYFLFENYGLQYTSAANGSLIVSTVPIFTIIFNRIFLKERFSPVTIIGIILSFIGIYILIFGFSGSMELNLRGDIVMFLSVVSWIGYTYYAKNTRRNYGVLTVTRELSLWGAVFFIPFVIYDCISNPAFITNTDISVIIPLVYLGIICSAIAYLMWNKALKEEDAHLVNAFIYLIPLFSIITEVIYTGEMPRLRVYISAPLIIAGLFIAHIFSKGRFETELEQESLER